MWDFDCAVIGGGPGGLVSTLYLRRFQRRVALIQCGKPRAAWIPRTHNLLGYEYGISGAELLRRLGRQLARVGVERFRGQGKLRRWRSGFEVTAGSQRLHVPRVILATGITDTQPEVENVVELREAGLLRYCSICDAYEHRDQPLVVIAADDLGLQKALFLRSFTRKLAVILPEALRLAPQRRRELERARVKLIRGRLEALERARRRRGVWVCVEGWRPLFYRAAYIELGCTVNDSAFARLTGLRRAANGMITTTTEQRTTVPGLLAVGDCVNVLAQISVAAGQAAVAATTVHNDLLAY